MRARRRLAAALLVVAGGAVASAAPASDTLASQDVAGEQLVFGSFRNPQNAANWATRVQSLVGVPIEVLEFENDGAIWYRVASQVLPVAESERVRRAAAAQQLTLWPLTGPPNADPRGERASAEDTAGTAAALEAPLVAASPQQPVRNAPPVRPAETLNDAQQPAPRDGPTSVQQLDVDIGAQARSFFDTGIAGQARFHASLSARLDYYRSWDEERQSFTLVPFYRYDAEDDERTHFDLREAFWSRVGQRWDLHVGVRQVFWGVTEFKHLVDIVNQTDLVESIDGEDKLGQPMLQLSLLGDWGILDLHLLTGFRERTFAGVDGRPRFYLPIDDDEATYESGAGDERMDAAVRWSHHVGPFDLGVHYFSGTSRDPLFEPVIAADGSLELRPHYPVIDQLGVDAQAITGDWAWKLEAIGRKGFGERYFAYNAGFERTLVGLLGSRMDLGLVVEYLYDDRGDDAFDTIFEHDVAFGTRWQLNDLGDSQALLGLIWDHESDEITLSLEASRRLGETWTLLIEGRAFTGAEPLNTADPFDPANKMGSLAKDDYIELELTKYF